MKDPIIKWIFGMLAVLLCAGVVGAIVQYALVASLQTEVQHLKANSKKSLQETNKELAAKKRQRQVDKSQWQSFRSEVNGLKESLQHHDRILYTFHGQDILERK
jgi:septal ring factor EnvC (AmiA/AmiB activator)